MRHRRSYIHLPRYLFLHAASRITIEQRLYFLPPSSGTIPFLRYIWEAKVNSMRVWERSLPSPDSGEDAHAGSSTFTKSYTYIQYSRNRWIVAKRTGYLWTAKSSLKESAIYTYIYAWFIYLWSHTLQRNKIRYQDRTWKPKEAREGVKDRVFQIQ